MIIGQSSGRIHIIISHFIDLGQCVDTVFPKHGNQFYPDMGSGFCVIDCRLELDEVVRPMVPGGANITNFLLE